MKRTAREAFRLCTAKLPILLLEFVTRFYWGRVLVGHGGIGEAIDGIRVGCVLLCFVPAVIGYHWHSRVACWLSGHCYVVKELCE